LSWTLTDPVYELHLGKDKRQQPGAIEAPPALLGHVEQLERHQQSLGPRARAPGRALRAPADAALDRDRRSGSAGN